MSGEKINYIGGDLELDLEFFSKPELNRHEEYFLFNKAKDYALVSMGRDALKLALLTEGLRAGDEVLIPSFLCVKVIDVLEELNLKYRLFNIEEGFEVVSDHLLSMISEKTKAVIFINYFGYSSPDFHLMETIKGKGKNIAIILDYAQALFSITEAVLKSPFVDYVVTSLRKFLPVPDGAFLIANKKQINQGAILQQTRRAVFERGLGKIVKNYYLNSAHQNISMEQLHLDLVCQSEKHFDLEQGVYGMSALSCELLKHIDFEVVATQRKKNTKYLYEHLDTAMLPKWDGKTVLLVVPVLLKNRDRVRSLLMKQNIYLPIHWPIDERIDREKHPVAHQLAERELGLVIDQRYGLEDMKYLTENFKEVA